LELRTVSKNYKINFCFSRGKSKKTNKIAANDTTIFVYDASGKLVAEIGAPNASKENIYAGSRLLATEETSGISYLTNDTLGSPRILTNGNGVVISRRDFLPFGEEINAGTGGRNSAQGYFGVDSIRQKFTGYERDNETELNFAQARMYSSKLGRFNTSDPLYIEAKRLRDPQRINLYVYTRNSPLRFTDSLGLDITFKCDTTKDCEDARDKFNKRTGNQFQVKLGKGNVLEVVSLCQMLWK
jgi:RHS repeat-associated protein